MSLGGGVIVSRVLTLIALILTVSLFHLTFASLAVVLATLRSDGLPPLDETSQIGDLIMFVLHLRMLY